MTRILQDGDPLLHTVSEPVTEFGPELDELVAVMLRTLAKRGGLGLSAVQIGVPKRVLLITERGQAPLVMVNPAMTRHSRDFVSMTEGCLSVSDGARHVSVFRPRKCDASWFDLGEHEHVATLTNMTARIFQHELDHLNGVLMTDRMK